MGIVPGMCLFLSTPSARRATRGVHQAARPSAISIHALCEEGDYSFAICLSSFAYFYPRPLRGGRRSQTSGGTTSGLFLSTPSARRATSEYFYDKSGAPYFYPRPLRGGRRLLHHSPGYRRSISIHALCEEGDLFASTLFPEGVVFLSTPSARRATRRYRRRPTPAVNFYPRPLRGGRPVDDRRRSAQFRFLSTPSARRATRPDRTGVLPVGISIHALCEEGDRQFVYGLRRRCDFYPRPLRGGRPDKVSGDVAEIIFLSTPSARRATRGFAGKGRAGMNFYPRPLRGGRRRHDRQEQTADGISIHALCEEGDRTAQASSKRP